MGYVLPINCKNTILRCAKLFYHQVSHVCTSAIIFQRFVDQSKHYHMEHFPLQKLWRKRFPRTSVSGIYSDKYRIV